MANIADYLPGGEKDPNAPADGIDAEITDAQEQQSARLSDSTPSVDWQKRYQELEKLNSRQAQTLGEYRRTIDEFISSPTSTEQAAPQDTSPKPITWDDLSEDPDEAVRRAVESHPAIQEARQLKKKSEEAERERAIAEFQSRHSDYTEIAQSPEFQNWVVESPTRVELYTRGNQYDFSAADALFSLYKAEKGLNQAKVAEDISQAELVSSSGEMVQEPPRYSRSEYIAKLQAARQGNLEAEAWVKRNAAGYRKALESGNVRD